MRMGPRQGIPLNRLAGQSAQAVQNQDPRGGEGRPWPMWTFAIEIRTLGEATTR